MAAPKLSVVIPVYNEEAVLPALFARLYPALDALGESYEVIFVNDGSSDRSAALLRGQFELRSDVTRVILFNGNFGQHLAIMAGFEATRGERVVTLDADLQNPPEEIAKLLAKMDEGYDYVGSVRSARQDTAFRRSASRIMNAIRERITRIRMTDQGCMLRAYSHDIVAAINRCHEVNTFIPALAYTFAQRPTEIEVAHEERAAGESKYSLYKLVQLNFDLVTSFSVKPLNCSPCSACSSRSPRCSPTWSSSPSAGFSPTAWPRGCARSGTATSSSFSSSASCCSALGCSASTSAGSTSRCGSGPVTSFRPFSSKKSDEVVEKRFPRENRVPRKPSFRGKRFSTTSNWGDQKGACPLFERPVTSAVVFAYHDVGCRCLKVLLDQRIEVPLVVTHRDDPGEDIWFGSVAALAHKRAIETITPEDPNAPEIVEKIRALQPDFLFSFYYRLMLSPALLAAPKRGAFNLHGSLLPKYRGRAPVNWAIIHGETETGATLHEMVEKPDAGRIVDQEAVAILPDDLAVDVFGKVTEAAERVLRRSLPKLADGSAVLRAQDLSKGGYFGGRGPEDGRIDWSSSAKRVHDLVRAVAPPYPGAFTEVDRKSVV